MATCGKCDILGRNSEKLNYQQIHFGNHVMPFSSETIIFLSGNAQIKIRDAVALRIVKF
jgi:hypothetical protein